MVKPILLISAILAAVSMAAPAGPEFAPESVAVRSDDFSESNSLEKRSFAATCNPCGLTAGTTFLCACKRADGGNYNSPILLNECLGNADGWLTWQKDGYFGNSCRDFRYDAATTRFHVTCRTVSGNWIASSVVLDERMHNSNGRLWCGV
ncbi:hypothetical protein BHE90_001308 [Fusarium euwallaceae]|uniref:Cyanovirin-N domain-containing protein n=3 Tax=Fusarium solani species complex TaxID=232080 RepID=A0A428TW15_9HYPO|nr:hypothetical protein CEP51_006314 [Fusarium floridanum]RSM06250.1 hypothetical protein CEP52_005828 [Fusarium oligoseptatum]RTE84163.1 hypothetical protein BHE90_001308 [Fusarium euwallaceae]